MTDQLDGRRRAGRVPLDTVKNFLAHNRPNRFKILLDNDDDADVISAFLNRQGFEVGVDTDGASYFVEAFPSDGSPEGPVSEAAFRPSGTLALISGTALGPGQDDLGRELMRRYILTLNETGCQPDTLIFIHEGVCLPIGDSRIRKTLEALAARGTRVMFCLHSVTFFNINPMELPGEIADMPVLSRAINRAEKILGF